MIKAEGVKEPFAVEIPKEINYHGNKYIDNYSWLREKESPEVISYLEEENKYTESLMSHTKDLQEKLYLELLGRIKETDTSAPEKVDEFYYYSRTEEGRQYRVYCRKKDSMEANEEILLDLNELAEGHPYFSLGCFKISPDHRLLAYSTDNDGSESYTLNFLKLETREHFPEKISNVSSGVEWSNDNKTVFYCTLDETQRPFKLFSHELGTEPKNDKLLSHEKDEGFFIHISKTNSKEYLLVTMVSQMTSEVFYMKADNASDILKLVEPRQYGTEYYLEHRNDIFYVITNDDAVNFRVMTTPVEDPSKKNWKEFIAHRENVRLDSIQVFKNYIAVYERENGLKTINIKSDTEDYYIDFPEPVYTYSTGRNKVFDTETLRFDYESLTTPDSVYDFNMATRERKLVKRYEVLGGYNPEDYVSDRLFATADDGTMIPISIVYKKGMKKDGSNPLYLYGYGSYEISIDPSFNSNRLSLLDRGFIYAIAHIRGGGDMGRQWYENGKFLKKKNTFSDFINAAEFLVKDGYTSKDKMVTAGGSAGGLLMGAVTNLRPDLFKGVIAHVPFVDVINTMMDATLPLTVIEYDEWGNPNEKEYFDYMMSYSPYDNVKAQDYPHMLITGGLNDPRVGYWEPAKWVAKLRKNKTGKNILLLKTYMGAGHSGPSGRYDYLKDIAFEYAFILELFEIS